MATSSDDVQSISIVQALTLVQSFLGPEWHQTLIGQVELRKVTGGFVNRLFLLTRNTSAISEPACILIRYFGTQGPPQDPPESNTTLSALEQALVYRAMAQRDWGPKLYGVFAGGRLEEWIDAHPLTAQESMDPALRQDIARSYARLHSLDLSLSKDRFRAMVNDLISVGQRAEEFARILLVKRDARVVEFAEILRSTDWKGELEWVSGLFVEHNCRPAFVIGDANYLNVLVKNYKSECQIMLIDYETLSYGYRGFDIGGHFNERMYQYDRPESVLSGCSAPDFEEQQLFCEAYLRETQMLGLPLTKIDTTEHLLLESKVGRLFHILFSVLMCFNGELTDKPSLLAGLTHMMTIYRELKAGFDQRPSQPREKQ